MVQNIFEMEEDFLSYIDDKYCCKCCKGERGERGPQGVQGIQGERGEKGETGRAVLRPQGSFYGFPTGPFSNGSLSNPVTLPLTAGLAQNTEGAFTLNSDGTVTINEAGMYLLTGRTLVAVGYAGNFNFQYNGRAIGMGTINGCTLDNGGVATTTVVAFLKEGDRIGNCFAGTGPINLVPYVDGIKSPSSMITLVKIDDLPPVMGDVREDIIQKELP